MQTRELCSGSVLPKVRLSTNPKTKVMCNEFAGDVDEPTIIDSNEIEDVDHYIYLDRCISMDSASKEQEIKRRNSLGWQAFGRAIAIFRNKDTPILKRQVFTNSYLWIRNLKFYETTNLV